jgi:hypothetical protein
VSTYILIALYGAIMLCLGWLYGYTTGKKINRPRIVHPEPEIEYVTRLNSRHRAVLTNPTGE